MPYHYIFLTKLIPQEEIDMILSTLNKSYRKLSFRTCEGTVKIEGKERSFFKVEGIKNARDFEEIRVDSISWLNAMGYATE